MSPAHNPVEMLNYNQLVIDVNGTLEQKSYCFPAPFSLTVGGTGIRRYKSQRKKNYKEKIPKAAAVWNRKEDRILQIFKNCKALTQFIHYHSYLKEQRSASLCKTVRSEWYYRFTRNYGCSFRLYQGK